MDEIIFLVVWITLVGSSGLLSFWMYREPFKFARRTLKDRRMDSSLWIFSAQPVLEYVRANEDESSGQPEAGARQWKALRRWIQAVGLFGSAVSLALLVFVVVGTIAW